MMGEAMMDVTHVVQPLVKLTVYTLLGTCMNKLASLKNSKIP